MPEAQVLLEVRHGDQSGTAAFLRSVPGVVAVQRHAKGLVARVHAPYEGQLAGVLCDLRQTPGLQALRVVSL